MNEILNEFLACTIGSYEAHQKWANQAISQVPNAKMHEPLCENTNSIVVVMKHVSGNLRSRWTDFLTSDGEKPWRDRDQEFIDDFESREQLMDYWQGGWECVYAALKSLSVEDLARNVSIRGHQLTVPKAIQRSLTHTAYHIGQIIMLARFHCGDHWETLTIAKGGSEQFNRENWGPLSS